MQNLWSNYNVAKIFKKNVYSLTGIKGELQSLEMLSDIVRKELKRRPSWLLVIDNLTGLHPSLDGGAGPIVTTPSQYEGGAGTIMPALPIQQSSLVTGYYSNSVH